METPQPPPTNYPRGPIQMGQPSARIDLDLIRIGWETIRPYWGLFAGAGAVMAVFYAIGYGASTLLAFGAMFDALDSGSTVEIEDLIVPYAIQFGIAFVMAFATGSFFAGISDMAIRAYRREEVEFRHLFGHFDRFFKFGAASLLYTVAVMVGTLFCYIPGFVVGGLFMLAIPAMVDDRKLGVIDAFRVSLDMTRDALVLAAVLYLVLSLIASAGIFACGVGILLTFPYMYATMAVAYARARSASLEPPPSMGVIDFTEPPRE